jgi:hypothetical protein
MLQLGLKQSSQTEHERTCVLSRVLFLSCFFEALQAQSQTNLQHLSQFLVMQLCLHMHACVSKACMVVPYGTTMILIITM